MQGEKKIYFLSLHACPAIYFVRVDSDYLLILYSYNKILETRSFTIHTELNFEKYS